MTLLVLLLAVVAAGRGVWSPCGLSMLSTITPLGERGRGNRYASTAAWYIVGSVAGGLSLGAVAAAGAALLGDPLPRSVLALAAGIAVASDTRLLGFEVPIHRRQVNERWLDRYRPWVYGAGFGWQVGSGFATYIMTAANHLLVVLAVGSGSPRLALAAGALFGLVRGLAVLLTRRATSPGALRDVHERVHRAGPWVRHLVVAVEVAVAVVAVPSFAVVAVAVGVAAWWLSVGARSVPVCSLDASR